MLLDISSSFCPISHSPTNDRAPHFPGEYPTLIQTGLIGTRGCMREALLKKRRKSMERPPGNLGGRRDKVPAAIDELGSGFGVRRLTRNGYAQRRREQPMASSKEAVLAA